MLARRGINQVAPTAEEPGGLWPAERFPAAEPHKIRASVDKRLEILRGRERRCSIDDDTLAAAMRDRDSLLKR